LFSNNDSNHSIQNTNDGNTCNTVNNSNNTRKNKCFWVSSFTDEVKYKVVVGSDGMFCWCDNFLMNFGRPCKHIFLSLLHLKLINETFADGYASIKKACISLGINVELNSTRSIPHFIPNSIFVSNNSTGEFKKISRGRKKNKYGVTHPELETGRISTLPPPHSSSSSSSSSTNVSNSNSTPSSFNFEKNLKFNGFILDDGTLNMFGEIKKEVIIKIKKFQFQNPKKNCKSSKKVNGVRINKKQNLSIYSENKWITFSYCHRDEVKNLIGEAEKMMKGEEVTTTTTTPMRTRKKSKK
jgi:hypothetical protein